MLKILKKCMKDYRNNMRKQKILKLVKMDKIENAKECGETRNFTFK